jgi:hypothetical protein
VLPGVLGLGTRALNSCGGGSEINESFPWVVGTQPSGGTSYGGCNGEAWGLRTDLGRICSALALLRDSGMLDRRERREGDAACEGEATRRGVVRVGTGQVGACKAMSGTGGL